MEVHAGIWEPFSQVTENDQYLIKCIGVGVRVFHKYSMSEGTQGIRHSRGKILEGLFGE